MFVYKIPYRRAPRLACSAFRPSASREQRYLLYARYLCSHDALGLKAGQARRATIGYLVYKGILHTKSVCERSDPATRGCFWASEASPLGPPQENIFWFYRA